MNASFVIWPLCYPEHSFLVGTRGWGPPGGQLIICWGLVIGNNGLISFIADYWVFNPIAISYILSKFEASFYLGPQLIIFTLQEFNASLERLHLSRLLLLLPLNLFDANGETDLRVCGASDCSTLRLLRVDQMRNGVRKSS